MNRGIPPIAIASFALLCLGLAGANCLGRALAGPQTTAVSSADAALSEGMSQLQRGDLAAARAAFEKAVKLAPGNAAAHNILGWTLLAQSEVEPAIVQFRAALRINPSFASGHMHLASALVRLTPKDSEAHRTLGRALAYAGQTDEAALELKGALELGADRAEVHDEYGALLAKQKKTAEAAEQFQVALRLQPGNASAQLHLGVLRLQENKSSEAAEELRGAVRLSPQDPPDGRCQIVHQGNIKSCSKSDRLGENCG